MRLAARNNAIWCDTFCRAHGVPGEFSPMVWLNRNALPPYYPNPVVVSDAGVEDGTLEHIRDLMSLPLPASWAVKDSFNNLKLESFGFDLLFEASWIWRELEPGLDNANCVSTGINWSRVTSPTELAQWEGSWAGNPQNPDAGTPGSRPRLSRLNFRELSNR